MLRPLSLAVFFASGFLYFVVGLVAFVTAVPLVPKLEVLASVVLVATVLLGIGLALSRTRQPRLDAGVVLAVSASVSVMTTGMLYFMANFAPPLLRQQFDERDIATKFGDWPTGGLYLVALGVMAALLLRSKHEDSASP